MALSSTQCASKTLLNVKNAKRHGSSGLQGVSRSMLNGSEHSNSAYNEWNDVLAEHVIKANQDCWMKDEKAVPDKPSLCVSGGVALLETPHSKRWSPLPVFPFGFFLGWRTGCGCQKALSCTNGPFSGRNPHFV